MSINEFWKDIRLGRNLYSHHRVEADSTRISTQSIENQLNQCYMWLSPKVTQEFDKNDFDFLTKLDQEKLSAHVEKFNAISSTVLPNSPATTEQVEKAAKEFAGILEVIRLDKYTGDSDAFVIGKMFEKSMEDKAPNWVRDWKFKTGYDVIHTRAIWVWVIIEDHMDNEEVILAGLDKIREQLKKLLKEIESDRWPYIQVQTVSEQTYLKEETTT